MVSGPGCPPIVTAVIKVLRPKQKGSGGVRQQYADLAQRQLLLVGHDQKFESAPQAFAITHQGSYLHDVRRDRDGKLEGNNFASLQLTAEGRPDAVVAEFVGSSPVCGRQAFAKHRHLNACVKTITGETPQPPRGFRCRLCGVAQSSFSIADLPFKSLISDSLFLSARRKVDEPSPAVPAWPALNSSAIVLQRRACPQQHQSACTKEVSVQAKGVPAALPRLRIFFQLPDAFQSSTWYLNGIWRKFTRKAA